jgi:hypothetical protein
VFAAPCCVPAAVAAASCAEKFTGAGWVPWVGLFAAVVVVSATSAGWLGCGAFADRGTTLFVGVTKAARRAFPS